MKLKPKDKAVELINKFTIRTKFLDEFKGWVDYTDSSHAKQFALIAVDELIDSHYLLTTTHDVEPSIRCKSYWKEVKEEIENL